MLRRLLSYSEVPPDGYKFVHPETGHTTWAEDIDTWLAKAIEHRKANNLDIPPNLLAKMEDQLCEILPPGFCQYDDPQRPRVDMRFGLRDVMAWAEAHLKILGDNFVFQEEAERRAKICATCYMNVEGQGCRGCSQVATLFTNKLAIRKTSADPLLKSCAACKCFLRSAVHFPLTILESVHKSEVQMLLPSFCWQKENGVNYLPDAT